MAQRNEVPIAFPRLKVPKWFIIAAILLTLLNGRVLSARKGGIKGLTGSNSSKMMASSVAPYDQSTCPADRLSESVRQNLTTFRQALHDEIDRRLQSLSDMIKHLMQEQISCFEKREKKLLSEHDCKEKLIAKASRPEDEFKIPVCESPSCKELAARMLDTIDHSADPCEDFYQYACGGLEEDINLDPVTPYREAMNRIQEKLETLEPDNPIMGPARTFYDACKEWRFPPGGDDSSQEALLYARGLSRRMGWFLPSAMVGKSFGEDFTFIPQPTNITYLLASFMKNDFTPFFDVSMEPDPSQKNRFVPRISLAINTPHLSGELDHITCYKTFQENVKKARRDGSALNLNAEYDSYINCKTHGVGLAYRLRRMGEAVSAMNLMDFVKNHTSRDELMQDTKFSTELLLSDCASKRPTEIDVKSALLNRDYQVHKLEDLSKVLGELIDWAEFLYFLTGERYSNDQKIHVYHHNETGEILEVLSRQWSLNKAAVHNSLMMLWSDHVYSSLVSPIEPDAEYCLRSTLFLLPDLASALYLHSFPDAQLTRLQRYVNTKASSVEKLLRSLTDDGGEYFSEKLKNKLRTIEFNIGAGYDMTEMNNTLTDSVKELHLNTSHPYNVDTLLRRKRSLTYALLHEDTDSPRALWMQGVVPFEQRAFVSHERNTIYLPYGTFFPPFFYYRQKVPEYVTYGGIGHLFARQVMHLMDETGSKFDGESRTTMEMPRSSIVSSECFNAQLSAEFNLYDKGVTGTYTIPSNFHFNDLMVDAWATRLSWMAYQSTVHDSLEIPEPTGETPEEHLIWMGTTPLKPMRAYFLRIAQTHCSKSSEFDLLRIMEDEHMLPRHRVNVVMRNEILFAKAFQCSPSSLMTMPMSCPFIFDKIGVPEK